MGNQPSTMKTYHKVERVMPYLGQPDDGSLSSLWNGRDKFFADPKDREQFICTLLHITHKTQIQTPANPKTSRRLLHHRHRPQRQHRHPRPRLPPPLLPPRRQPEPHRRPPRRSQRRRHQIANRAGERRRQPGRGVHGFPPARGDDARWHPG